MSKESCQQARQEKLLSLLLLLLLPLLLLLDPLLLFTSNSHAAHQPGIQSYRALRRKRAGMKLNGTFTPVHLKIRKKGRGGMQKGCRRTSTSTTQKQSKTKR